MNFLFSNFKSFDDHLNICGKLNYYSLYETEEIFRFGYLNIFISYYFIKMGYLKNFILYYSIKIEKTR